MALLHMGNGDCCRVPPGFRFHPTDEELVNYYLRKKVGLEKFDLEVIREVDLNKFEPWDLQERCRVDSTLQTDWYFFSHKDRKYPSGTRTNRATVAGFWKATGRDKAVNSNTKRIGMRKTLVFYLGRAPRGTKTDWIMHEYRLEEIDVDNGTNMGNEEDWVVCKVFKKQNLSQHKGHHHAQYTPSISLNEVEGKFNTMIMPKMLDYNCKDNFSSAITCKQEFDCNDANDQVLEFPHLNPSQMNSMSMDMDLLFTRIDSNPLVFSDFLGSYDSSSNSDKSPFISANLIEEYCNVSGDGSNSSTDWVVLHNITEENDITTTDHNTVNSNELHDVLFPILHPIGRQQLSEVYNLPNIFDEDTWNLLS